MQGRIGGRPRGGVRSTVTFRHEVRQITPPNGGARVAPRLRGLQGSQAVHQDAGNARGRTGCQVCIAAQSTPAGRVFQSRDPLLSNPASVYEEFMTAISQSLFQVDSFYADQLRQSTSDLNTIVQDQVLEPSAAAAVLCAAHLKTRAELEDRRCAAVGTV